MAHTAAATAPLDEIDDREVRIRRDDRHAESPWQGIGMLLALCLLSLLALGVLTTTVVRIDDNTTIWKSLVSLLKERDSAAHGGIRFGMTPARAHKAQPHMLLADMPGGETAGSFEFDGVPHAVAFLAAEHGRQAYRIRSQRTVTPKAADARLKSLHRSLGSPLESGCAKRIFEATRTCRYRWLASKGVSITLTTRSVIGSSSPRTEVSLVAVDTYLQGKRRRTNVGG